MEYRLFVFDIKEGTPYSPYSTDYLGASPMTQEILTYSGWNLEIYCNNYYYYTGHIIPGMMDCSTISPSPTVMVTQWVYKPDVSPRSVTESTRGLNTIFN